MPQLTLHKPNFSVAEAFFVSDSLYHELKRISRIFELDKINLAFLQEIQARVLSTFSKRLNTLDPSLIFQFASLSLDWFDELLALIKAIERLPNPHSLSISFTVTRGKPRLF